MVYNLIISIICNIQGGKLKTIIILTPVDVVQVDLLEKHLEQQLMRRIPGFNMNTFIELLM